MEGQEREKVNYWTVAFLYGLCCGVLPIIGAEILWDTVANPLWERCLARDITESFLRAALMEESFKFLGFWLADRRYKFTSEREFMLAAGMVGLVYGIIEKIVTMNLINIILGIVFPMHVLWQLNQGRHFYAYRMAKAQGDRKRARIKLFRATVCVFVMHGCWDALLSLVSYFIGRDDIPDAEVYGGLLFAGIIIAGILYTVLTLRKTIRVLKKK